MSINVNFSSSIQITESITILGKSTPITHTELTTNGTNLTTGTTPPATVKAVVDCVIGGGGTTTLDLTNLTDATQNATVNGNTLKLQLMKFYLPKASEIGTQSGNAVTISNGASNAYNPASASWSMPIKPGQGNFLEGNNVSPTISSSAKNILVTGTAGDHVYFVFVMG